MSTRVSCSLGSWVRLAGGGRALRLACAAKGSAQLKVEPLPVVNEQEHLQRSLDLGPAFKQAPAFEYVAVAFRSQPRSKRNKVQQRGVTANTKHQGGIKKIFGKVDDGQAYRTLEMVSGDRRLLFESTEGGGNATAASGAIKQHESAALLGNTDASTATADTVKTPANPVRTRRRADRQLAKLKQPGPRAYTSPGTAARTLESRRNSFRPVASRMAPAAAECPLRQGNPADASRVPSWPDTTNPSDEQPTQTTVNVPDRTSNMRDAAIPVSVSRLHHLASTDTSIGQQQEPKQPIPPQTSHSQQERKHPQPSPQRRAAARHSQRVVAAAAGVDILAADARAVAGERLAAAAALLQMPVKELHRYRGFCSELRALELSPAALAALCGVLVQDLGLAPPQLCAVLLRQPHVLRVPPGVLARRGAALALELQLPPPLGPGGGGPLAAIVVAVPDVLLRRSEFAGTTAALAEALVLPPADALALLCGEPQLLRHQPGFFALSVAQLREQLGLSPAAAAALAAAEPQLLSVSPGVLHANGALLRSRLQLQPEQLAEMAARAPELLIRSPGVLRAVVQRLTAVLSHSAAWREALPRLLASPRNLAVALSFGSDRYDRLEYLAATGRDRIMSFKEGLSLSAEEFQEVFPEYLYNDWRKAVAPQAQPARVSHHTHGAPAHLHAPSHARSTRTG
ncbi:hypothetical protein VOLCADRAFT_86366 [Volvox carteri f. nagariensis]|uniref:Uncharacterized protein n=1 Tax=Volvox carteri f. nagariensis TaxID=3068 RepID=D8TIK8_VOLCA|nr:uncharacterized protein VOLCADRAFT_86366 [Volvox carteri f. nagariensis]EFJ52905.1 hypothetical protein VOLCADRAFT_86366 [Volvox carteri f. nagariensis]|eukprot:XP_002945910.1 hypothetical protein VOLCADRAFT_86366 [Volvox carteri f. nagariensis]